MELTYRREGDVDVLEIRGRFDAHGTPMVARWLGERLDASNVVVNLQGVVFIDSAALSILVKGLKHCRQNKGDLYLCGMQQAVRIIFELTRLDQAFPIFEKEQEALEEFAKPANLRIE